MKARIRRISTSVDTSIPFGPSSSSEVCLNAGDLTTSTDLNHEYNPSSKSLDICGPESRIERMRKLLSSPLLRRRNASHHGPLCSGHHDEQHHGKQVAPSSSSSSSPSWSPALGSSTTSSMKTFGVSLESLSHHQHPHHQQHSQQHFAEECHVRDTEHVVVPHQKAAHILGQVCPGCLTSAPSNSSSMGSINETSSGHYSHHNSHEDYFNSSMSSSMVASPSSGTSSSSTTSSNSSAGGPSVPCLIPYIVTRLCNYIESNGGLTQEGLFRINGNAKLVDKLKHSFDLTGDAPLEAEGDLASAATLLKQFLRELPQPLIPNGAQFLDVIRSLKNDHETCVLSLKALISQLPDENYYTLRYLIRFLHRIAQRNDENRMNSSNLGIVFAPNIFRVCVDTYQGLRDQSLANEVVTFFISEFSNIFNEINEVVCTAEGAGNTSSHEDLSSAISYESESSCPYLCPLNINIIQHDDSTNCEDLVMMVDPPPEYKEPCTDSGLESDPKSNKNEATLQLTRKRKDYQNKNHRTIEEFFDDERCQSFDCSQSYVTVSKPQPQRSNSDGASEDLCFANEAYMMDKEENSRRNCGSHTHEIIVTNSSDSVSTDENTTTTATSTGPTVYSVVTNQPLDTTDISEGNIDIASSYVSISKDLKLLACENMYSCRGPRSGSCGSDCTENLNITSGVGFNSDDAEDEDSLSKSIASDCSDDSSSVSSDSDKEYSPHSNECDADVGSSSGNECSRSQHKTFASDKLKKSEETLAMVHKDIDTKCSSRSDAEMVCLEEHSSNNACFHYYSLSDLPQSGDIERQEDPTSSSALSSANRECNLDKKAKQVGESGTSDSASTSGLKSRTRRLQSIKRKLRQFEIDFEQENGYKASFEQKMSSSFARPLMVELSSILNIEACNLRDIENCGVDRNLPDDKDEFKQIDSRSNNKQLNAWRNSSGHASSKNSSKQLTNDDIFKTIFGDPKEKNLAKMKEMMDEIQRTLYEKRVAAKRPESLEDMTWEQTLEEKIVLQKVLLRFEAMHGRPSSKLERDIVRPVYDRYRLVKRHAAKQKIAIKEASCELQPIIENVQMNFKLALNQPESSMIDMPNRTNEEYQSESNPSQFQGNLKSESTRISGTAGKLVEGSGEINYHELTLDELQAQLVEVRQQKRNLRSVIRTFENDFFKKSGRQPSKEDRAEHMRTIYLRYKSIKGRVRLLQALLTKQVYARSMKKD